jgi:SAM-dependent methyltransferase
MSDDYSCVEGYVPDADLYLGCGMPTEYAALNEGDYVLDLGSGAGNDVFIARRSVGERGKVIGLDMTQEMIDKARQNCDKLGYNNVEFRLGEIEKMPVGGNIIDVVISNCVLNLVPNKQKAFCEIFRVLKPGGHFCISDIVLKGELPAGLQPAAEMYAGCVTGAIQMEDYLSIIEKTGFTNIKVYKEKSIVLPDDLLLNYMSDDELQNYRNSGAAIISITVYAEKSGNKSCC